MGYKLVINGNTNDGKNYSLLRSKEIEIEAAMQGISIFTVVIVVIEQYDSKNANSNIVNGHLTIEYGFDMIWETKNGFGHHAKLNIVGWKRKDWTIKNRNRKSRKKGKYRKKNRIKMKEKIEWMVLVEIELDGTAKKAQNHTGCSIQVTSCATRRTE